MTLYHVFAETQNPYTNKNPELVRLLVATDDFQSINKNKLNEALGPDALVESIGMLFTKIVDMREANQAEIDKWTTYHKDNFNNSSPAYDVDFDATLYDTVMDHKPTAQFGSKYKNYQAHTSLQKNQSSDTNEKTEDKNQDSFSEDGSLVPDSVVHCTNYKPYTSSKTATDNDPSALQSHQETNKTLVESDVLESLDNSLIDTLANIFKEYLTNMRDNFKNEDFDKQVGSYKRYVKDSETTKNNDDRDEDIPF